MARVEANSILSTTILLLGLLLLTQTANAQVTDVDGVWSDWSELQTDCTVMCGGGSLKRIRTCSRPSPAGAGEECLKEDNVTRSLTEVKDFACNTEPCWDQSWTDWSDCNVNCSIGVEVRRAQCGPAPCTGFQALNETRECNTWDIETCPDPCIGIVCPKYAICRNLSTVERPIAKCICTMGYEMTNGKCVIPPPTPPTPRPIPTLPPAQKIVATVISKTASTVLIVCVSICLIVFLMARVFTPDRVIQMNMEIALLAAHLFLLFPSSTSDYVTLCRIISIVLHFLFTAVFMFMMLESLHMYSLVGSVVQHDGMFTRAQNVLIGWGVPLFITLFSMCFEYENYGGIYHCWLQMDKNLNWAAQIPIYTMMIIMLSLTEAAGLAENKGLEGMNAAQLTSAKFSQRTNLILLPFVYFHWLLGVLSEYQQNLYLYSCFSFVNAALGVLVLLLHCSNNEVFRNKLKGMCKKAQGKKTTAKPLKPEEN